MKICFITNNTITKHATMKRAFGMANPLAALGHEVTICLEDAEDNRVAMAKCPQARAYYYTPGSVLNERRQKQAFLKHNYFDIVHICGLGFRNAILPQKCRTSFVIMDHVELESSMLAAAVKRRIFQSHLEWWSLLVYNGSVLASKYLEYLFLRRLHFLGKRRPLLYLPYAYDPHSLNPDSNKIDSLRASYPQKKIIVYMGGINRSYGCFEMLESFRLLASRKQNFVAIILGRGLERDEAINFVQQHQLEQVVEFKGYVPEEDVPTFLYSADVLLSPLHDTVTDWARCPSKLLMYMATQKPIVTCAIGEAWEYLGKDGFYYQPGSVDSMSKAIERAMDVDSQWQPNYDPSQHAWQVRVQAWLDWIYQQKPELSHGG